MASVVNDDVENRDLLPEAPPEITVGLISNEYAHRITFVSFAGRFDVDAIYFAPRSEVVSPHLQAAATVDADFQDVCIASAKTVEVAVVDLKVVVPLPNSAPCLMSGKISPERTRFCRSVRGTAK